MYSVTNTSMNNNYICSSNDNESNNIKDENFDLLSDKITKLETIHNVFRTKQDIKFKSYLV